MLVTRKRLRRIGDLIEDHPFEIGISISLILFGIRALLTEFRSAPGSVQTLPFGLAFVYCFLAIVGGLSIIVGLNLKHRYSWAYGIERLGLFVCASAWGSYIVGLLFSPITDRSTLLIGALLALVLGCIIRARAINRVEQAHLVALRTVNHQKESES